MISDIISGGSLGAMEFECVEEDMGAEREREIVMLLIGLVYTIYSLIPTLNKNLIDDSSSKIKKE